MLKAAKERDPSLTMINKIMKEESLSWEDWNSDTPLAMRIGLDEDGANQGLDNCLHCITQQFPGKVGLVNSVAALHRHI